MQFTRTNILTDTPGGKSMSSGGIILEGNQGGSGGDYVHPTGWLWGNKYTGRETLDGDLTSHGTIRALNINANNLTAINADITNLDATNITSVNADIHNLIAEYGDIRYLNVLEQLNAWGADIDHATIRDLYVSGSAHFVELIIDKLNSTNGSLILSPAHATISRVEERNGLIYCYFPASDGEKEISNDFDIDDLVICQSFNVVEGENHDASNKFIWKRVVDKGTIDISDSDSESEMFTKEHWFSVMKTGVINDDYIHPSCNSEFELGDVVCTLGNWTKEGRQKAILLTSTNPNFVDIGNIVRTEPYDIHVYDTENQYIRTIPIGVNYDIGVVEYHNGVKEYGHYGHKQYFYDLHMDWNDCFDLYGDIKYGYKFEIKFKPHFEEKIIYDKTIRPATTHDHYYEDFTIIMKIKNYALVRKLYIGNTFKVDEQTQQLVIDFSDSHYHYGLYYIVPFSGSGNYSNKLYPVRTLDDDILNDEVYTLTITYDDNSYDDTRNPILQPDLPDDYFRLNTPPIIDDYYAGHEPDYERILSNEVYDLYSIKGIDDNDQTTYEYKPSSAIGENLITNGDFNSSGHWQTTFNNSPEGYDDFINTDECVYMRRPLCKEVYNWQATSMGNMYGNYLNYSDNLYLEPGIYSLTFDYACNNDNSPYHKEYFFQLSLLNNNDSSIRYDRLIFPNRTGYHKCSIIIGVGQEYTQYQVENYMPGNYINIDTSNENWILSFNTDECGNQNQLVIDNVRLCKINSSQTGRVYTKENISGTTTTFNCPCVVTQDNVDYRRYRNVIENPIDAPAIITFNNVNRFSLAGKHVSVLSPTYNLISASSVSGFSDLADSVSSLNSNISSLTNRVTTCESAIETNSQQILLKVNQTDFDRLSRTVENQGTRITQNASAISLKADQSTVDSMGTTISSLSSELLIQAGQISSMVTSISSINDTLVQYDTRITQNATSITLKADQSTVDSLSQTVTNQGTLIAQNATAITLKADQTTVDSLGITVSSLSSELTIQAGQISSLVSSVSSIDGEVVSLWSSITQLPDQISAYVYTELDGDLTQTGIDITNHQISLTADNFIVKNNNNNPTLYLNSQGLVESRLGFITNPRTGSEETFNPTFYALSMERFNNDPLRYAFGLNGYNKAYQNEPVINQNPDYTDSVLIDHFKFSTDVYNRTSDLSVRIPILTMNQDEVALYDESSNYYEKGILRDRFTLQLQPKEIAITWHGGQGTPQLGTVRDLEGNQVPGVEGWIGGNDKIISIGPGGCYLKDAISTVIYTGQDSFEEWIRTHGTDTTWTNIPSGAMVRVKHYAGDSYSQVIIKD